MKKDHYRNVFKSDHLGSADLEEFIEQGKKLIFTIREVRQEKDAKVAGKKIDANIAYFAEPIKPMVLNATNSKIVKSFVRTKEHPNGSPFVQDWNNVLVELYIDENVQMKGERTTGVRIRPVQPVAVQKQKPQFTEANFEKARQANATIEKIKTVYEITPEVEQKYNEYVTANTAQ